MLGAPPAPRIMRTLLFLLAALLPAIASAQAPGGAVDFATLIDSGEAVQADARLGLVTAVERNGIRAVSSSADAPTLYASIRDGAVLDWIAVGTDGRFLFVSPVVTAGTSVAEVHHACALATDGTAYCWQVPAPDSGSGDMDDGLDDE